jgi:hypothetical protein
MSKITTKVIMYTVLMSAGAGQMFAAEVDHTDHKKKGSWSLNCFRSCMRSAVDDVRENAPTIQALGTTTIEIAKTIAAAKGDEKAVRNLNAAQIVLDGAAAAAAGNDPHAALDIAEKTVLTVAPHAADDIEKLNGVVSQVETVAVVAAPLIKIAVENAEKK